MLYHYACTTTIPFLTALLLLLHTTSFAAVHICARACAFHVHNTHISPLSFVYYRGSNRGAFLPTSTHSLLCLCYTLCYTLLYLARLNKKWDIVLPLLLHAKNDNRCMLRMLRCAKLRSAPLTQSATLKRRSRLADWGVAGPPD